MSFAIGGIVLVQSEDLRVLAFVSLNVAEDLAALIVAEYLHNNVVAFAIASIGVYPRRFAMKEPRLSGGALYLDCVSSLDSFEAGRAEDPRYVLPVHYEAAVCACGNLAAQRN